jgi:hypothetical protein
MAGKYGFNGVRAPEEVRTPKKRRVLPGMGGGVRRGARQEESAEEERKTKGKSI